MDASIEALAVLPFYDRLEFDLSHAWHILNYSINVLVVTLSCMLVE